MIHTRIKHPGPNCRRHPQQQHSAKTTRFTVYMSVTAVMENSSGIPSMVDGVETSRSVSLTATSLAWVLIEHLLSNTTKDSTVSTAALIPESSGTSRLTMDTFGALPLVSRTHT